MEDRALRGAGTFGVRGLGFNTGALTISGVYHGKAKTLNLNPSHLSISGL